MHLCIANVFNNITSILHKHFLILMHFSCPRLTIPYAFLIGFMATIVPHLSWGLSWKNVELVESFCEKNGWINVLYLNNFLKQDEAVSIFYYYKFLESSRYVIIDHTFKTLLGHLAVFGLS
jgi:hypothetical protein